MEKIMPYLPIIIPYFLGVSAFAIFALVHVIKHPHYRFGNKAIWIFVVLIFQIIGPIAYLAFGRGEES